MAITIIGQTTAPATLSAHDPAASIPRPQSAPENQPIFEASALREGLAHPDPRVRMFVVEQIAQRSEELESWVDSLLERARDEDDRVASAAIGALGTQLALGTTRKPEIATVLVEHFRSARGTSSALAGAILGSDAPHLLIEGLRGRGRLDFGTYANVIRTLGMSGEEAAVAYLDKALDRSALLEPERLAILLESAWRTSHPKLLDRVLSRALRESAEESSPKTPSHGSQASSADDDDDDRTAEEENEYGEPSVGPAQAALIEVLSLPTALVGNEGAEEAWMLAETMATRMLSPYIADPVGAQALHRGLRSREAAGVLRALVPLLDREVQAPEATDRDLVTIQRHKQTLRMLLSRQGEIVALGSRRAALFVLHAINEAIVLCTQTTPAEHLAGVKGIVQALDGAIDATSLATLGTTELAAAFRARSPREMRPVATAIAREPGFLPKHLTRIVTAVFMAGHGVVMLQAAAEQAGNQILDRALRAAVKASPREAEAVLLEALEAPFEPTRLAALVLDLAAQLRTKRVALAVARAHQRLTEAAGHDALTKALLRVGDASALQLLEARAMPDEPEAEAFATLAAALGVAPVEPKPRFAKPDRAADSGAQRKAVDEATPHFRLKMRCEACKETFTYRIVRVLLDPEATGHDLRDSAYVGATSCKACGAIDQLTPTPEARLPIFDGIARLLESIRSGQPLSPPYVLPSTTTLAGKSLSHGAALRILDEQIRQSPDAIRPRLHRGQLRLDLDRPEAGDDADAVSRVDPSSVEAMLLKGRALSLGGDYAAAMTMLADCWRALKAAEHPVVRLYEAEDPQSVAHAAEDAMLRLSEHTPAPPDVDLEPARARREAEISRQLGRGPEREGDPGDASLENSDERQGYALGEPPTRRMAGLRSGAPRTAKRRAARRRSSISP